MISTQLILIFLTSGANVWYHTYMNIYRLAIKRFFVIGFLLALILNTVQPSLAQQVDPQATRDQLERQLKDIEEQIAQYEKQLAETTSQKNTLTNKVKALKKQQSSLQLQIKATNLKIAQLANKLDTTKKTIITNVNKLGELNTLMSKYIVLVQAQDDIPLWYRVLQHSSLSEVFSDLDNYSQLLNSLKDANKQISQVKKQLERQKEVLADQQDEAKNLLSVKVLQQQKLVDTVKTQSDLLQETKGKETNYQAVLKDAKELAAQIRNRIYQLLGVNTQITFGEALQIAQWVSAKTGVRSAFLLAVLTQESNLGKNVGTCNKPGGPPEKSWRVVMKPERDQQPFLQITQELGLNTDATPVSCPMRDKSGKQIGWGGAMGPAQFIPSTWMGYKNKVAVLTGKNLANPWDIRDAFAAAAIKLKADGAALGGKQNEWNAAMRYFSGSTNTRFRFYGDNVLNLANGYQKDIDQLK